MNASARGELVGERIQQEATQEEMDHALSIVCQHPWRFASTMKYVPHWYTLTKDWEGERASEDFVWLYTLMAEKGFDEFYGKRRFRVLVLNGWKYWVMDPLDRCVGINRKPLPGVKTPACPVLRHMERGRR